jgi:hypothetical protein
MSAWARLALMEQSLAAAIFLSIASNGNWPHPSLAVASLAASRWVGLGEGRRVSSER